MDVEKIFKFYSSHRWETNGALIGLFVAASILIVGFFKMLFIAICVGIGYYIGKRLSQDREYIKNLLDKILPPGTYR